MDTKVKIGIVSLGLIGGSIYKSLKKYDYDFVCITQNDETLSLLKKENVQASKDLSDLKNCNLVFVCSPMRNVLETLDKLENIVDKNTIVCDVASLKEFVTQKTRPYKFIPTHPMAGKETSGFESSCDDLFVDAKWVLTPFENTEKSDIEILQNVIVQTGAKCIVANAKEHDKAVALISHMPLVLSQALVMSLDDNDLAKKLASSGFRDMTRLSLSSTTMAQDMVEMNYENIFKSLKMVCENSQNLLKDYNTEKLENIKAERNSVYSKDGKNII